MKSFFAAFDVLFKDSVSNIAVISGDTLSIMVGIQNFGDCEAPTVFGVSSLCCRCLRSWLCSGNGCLNSKISAKMGEVYHSCICGIAVSL